MARRRQGPEQQIEVLEAERGRLAGERHELATQLQAAKAVLAAAPERHRRALVDKARGRDDGVEQVQADTGRAQREVAEIEPRIDALHAAEREIGEEIRVIFDADEGIAFFTVKAIKASEEAEAARAVAEAAYSDLRAAWLDAERQWGELRRAAQRRGEEEYAPKEVPRPSFAPPIPTISGLKGPWPGGRREWCEQKHAEVKHRRRNPLGKVSNREAIAAFADGT